MNVKGILLIGAACLLMPIVASAQGADYGDKIYSLNAVLDRLFEEMLPLCRRMIDVGRAIAGFAALLYISVRVWKHLAKAEPIDFFPLLRPFAIGMAIVLFPSLIALMNGVLKPVVSATAAMSKDSHQSIQYYIRQQQNAVKETPPIGFGTSGNDYDKYAQAEEQVDSRNPGSILSNAFSFFSIKSMIKTVISEVVQVLYAAAGLCINTIRTFYLIVLAILGPLVLGLSVFDGFSNTLASWFARYVNVFMWLPVANIFGAITSKILENMMNLDQSFSSSVAYIIFMIISIVGYTTVPNVAGYIIQAGGKDTLLHKVNNMTRAAGTAALKALV